jgi:hypothetical protein
LTSAIVGRGWSTSRPGRFTPGERGPVPIGYEAEFTFHTDVKQNSKCYRFNNKSSVGISRVNVVLENVFMNHRNILQLGFWKCILKHLRKYATNNLLCNVEVRKTKTLALQ